MSDTPNETGTATGSGEGPDADDAPLPEVLVADEHTYHTRLSRLHGEIRSLTQRVGELDDAMAEIQDALQVMEGAGRRLLEHTEPSVSEPEPADTTGDGEAAADTGAGAVVPGAGDGEQPAAPPEELGLRELVAWVRENVIEVVDRPNPRGKPPYWCPLWWRHPEALARLDAAHSSWVEAVCSPVGNARVVYWEHLDHQLGMLMSEYGPFRRCGTEHDTDAETRGLAHLDPDEATYQDFEDSQPTPNADMTPPPAPAPEPAAGDPTGPGGASPSVDRGARQAAPSPATPAAGRRPEHGRGR